MKQVQGGYSQPQSEHRRGPGFQLEFAFPQQYFPKDLFKYGHAGLHLSVGRKTLKHVVTGPRPGRGRGSLRDTHLQSPSPVSGPCGPGTQSLQAPPQPPDPGTGPL